MFLLLNRRAVEHPVMQRIVLLLRLRVWGAMRRRLVLLPACTTSNMSSTCLDHVKRSVGHQ